MVKCTWSQIFDQKKRDSWASGWGVPFLRQLFLLKLDTDSDSSPFWRKHQQLTIHLLSLSLSRVGGGGAEAGYTLETHSHLMPIQNHYLFIQGEFRIFPLMSDTKSFFSLFFTDVKVHTWTRSSSFYCIYPPSWHCYRSSSSFFVSTVRSSGCGEAKIDRQFSTG